MVNTPLTEAADSTYTACAATGPGLTTNPGVPATNSFVRFEEGGEATCGDTCDNGGELRHLHSGGCACFCAVRWRGAHCKRELKAVL